MNWFNENVVNETEREGAGSGTGSSPRPPGPAFAIPLERNGWSGAWGPWVENGALVLAWEHFLEKRALA